MTGAKALEEAMDQQRRVVRKRWNSVATDAGMTYQHMRKILNGKVPLTEFAASGFDRALGWPDGHAWDVYTVGSTAWLEDRGLELLDDTERQLWALDKLPEEERWSYIERHRELELERGRERRERRRPAG